MQSPKKDTAVSDALERAAAREGAKLPARFTHVPTPDLGGSSRRITDAVTGRQSDVSAMCMGAVRKVLSDLFPEEEP